MIISARSRSPSPVVGLSTRVISSWRVELLCVPVFVSRLLLGDPGCEEDGDPGIGLGAEG